MRTIMMRLKNKILIIFALSIRSFLVRIRESFLHQQLAHAHIRTKGCSHNGTMFADGSLVPSLEPCLNCKCVDSHLKCSLRVCPEQPVPPPRGCVLVHRRSSCCPHVSCKKYHNENENENRRVITTYNSNWYNDDADDWNADVDERQKTLSKNSLYRRIEDAEIDGNDQMCVHNGTIYRTGSAMSTSSLCSYCYCIGGKQKCVRPKCLITSPGCVPVFIDSSCCPIRYDCGLLNEGLITSLKTNTNYYRIENKHYNRMRSRAQRNRGKFYAFFMRFTILIVYFLNRIGCLVASTYYAEGEKLPTEFEKPCDICFCIRGEKKCTPKKCAPYIGNCKPKIPEGQCCPANYECDHSNDTPFGSSHRPRQFDLLSYFFSDDTTENDANKEPLDPQPFPQAEDYTSSPISSTSEKSFFDAIREGLNYIDSNDEHVEKILDSAGVNATTVTDRPLHRNATELSFLDIFLGDDDDDDDDDESGKIDQPLLFNDKANLSFPTDDATVYVQNLSNGDSNNDRYALLNEDSTYETTTLSVQSESLSPIKISNYDRSATERIIKDYITYTSVPDYNFETTFSTKQEIEASTLPETSTQEQSSLTPQKYETNDTFDDGNSAEWSTSIPTLDDDIFTETTFETESPTKFQPVNLHYKNESASTTTTEPSIVSTFFEKFSDLFGEKNSSKGNHNSRPQNIQEEATTFTEKINIEGMTHSSTQSPSVSKTTRKFNPTIISSPAYPYVTPSVEKSPASTVTVTIQKPKTTSMSSTTTTFIPPTIPSKSPTTITIHSTSKSHETTTLTSTTASFQQNSDRNITPPKVSIPPTRSNISRNENPPTTKIILTASQPTLIDSNPSILDSDLNYDYGDQPTLPPSLPNLKIIPFLPTDAVRKENVHPKLEYYSTISTSYPLLTENYENPYSENQNADFTAFDVDVEAKDTFNLNNDNPDFNSYSIKNAGYSNDDVFGIPKTNGELPDYRQYPSLTEKPDGEPTINKYPLYNIDYDYESYGSEKHDSHKYALGSFEELNGYSVQSRNPSFDKFATDYPQRRVYSKIEFSTSNPIYGYSGNGINKFSPPSKTEGGFLPREPLEDDQYYDKLHTTKNLPDLITEPSSKANGTKQLIGITSDDPFKNVIRTEPPPNLITLIEDKEKLFQTIPQLSDADIDHDYPSIHLSDIEKEIISITTDSNYNSSPEYAPEPLPDKYSIHHAHNSTTSLTTSNIKNSSVDSEKSTNKSTKYSTEVSVSSNVKPNPTPDASPKDLIGSLIGYLFKDNKINPIPKPTQSSSVSSILEAQTIPPFKKISSTSLSLMDILNFTKPVDNSSKNVDVPQRKNNKIYEYPTTSEEAPVETSTPRAENLNILRDVLLATLNSPSNVDSIGQTDTRPTIDVPKPIYSSHSIHQFLNPIFAGNSDLTHVTSKYSPISSDIDLTIPKLNSQIGDNRDELNNNVFGPESYQVLNDYPSISNQRPFGENPIDYDTLKGHQSDENSANIYTQPLNTFQNSMGMLKLAGCNIYGRMYRVGRIITELSNPCLECKCTEVGVHCTTLSC